MTEVNPSPVASTQERGEPRHSGRVVHQPESFIGLKSNPSKLESRTDICLFVDYPKGTKGYLFYDPQE